MQSSYPLAERDPNISGRTSRASNLSTGSKGNNYRNGNLYRKPSNFAIGKTELLPAAPGVLGMLRTTTEIGDVALLPFSNKKFGRPVNQNGFARRNGTTSRQSNSSASSQQLRAPSYHQAWPSVSSAGPRRSMTSNVNAPSFPDQSYLSNLSGRSQSPFVDPALYDFTMNGNSGRTLSLSNANIPPGGFPRHRSLTSLRSRQGPVGRPVSPGYRYPTRLKRPGFRSSSPALSDVANMPSVHSQNRSRLNPGHGFGINTATHAPPYPAIRNRSAPTVTTLSKRGSSQALRGHGMPVLPRDDETSSSDQSINRAQFHSTKRARKGIINKPSFSTRTSSRSSITVHKSSTSIPPMTSRTPPILEMPVPVIPEAENIDDNDDAQVQVSACPDKIGNQDSLEQEVTDIYNDTISDITPMPSGLMERIRVLLDAVDRSETFSEHRSSAAASSSVKESILQASPDVPDVLPLISKRITRELILQALAPSSENTEVSTATADMSLIDSVEVAKEELTAAGTEGDSEVQEVDGPTFGSISQSVYSRPTNFTDLTELPISSTEAPPVPSLSASEHVKQAHDAEDLSPEMPLVARRTLAASEKPSQSSQSTRNSDLSANMLDRKRRRWSIRPPFVAQFQHTPVNSLKRIPSATQPLHESGPGWFRSSVRQTERSSTKSLGPSVNGWLVERKDASQKQHIPKVSRPIEDNFEERPIDEESPVVDLDDFPEPTAAAALTDIDTSSSHPYRDGGVREGCTQDSMDHDTCPVHDSPATWLASTDATESSPVLVNGYTGRVQDPIPEHAEVERFNMIRAGYMPLPDLKEESESKSDLRSMTSSFAAPGSRISGTRSLHDSVRYSKPDRSSKETENIIAAPKTYSVFKTTSTSLADTHAIPSLNFSCANLMSKLNDVLGNAGPSEEPKESVQPDMRANSANMREKYRSLFLSLEDIVTDHEELAELASAHQAEILDQLAELDDIERCDNIAHDADAQVPTLRPLSPHELIEEVNRLSVPSVGALTQRLSELFPTLRRYFGERPRSLTETTNEGEVLEKFGRTSLRQTENFREVGLEPDQGKFCDWPMSTSTALNWPLPPDSNSADNSVRDAEHIEMNYGSPRHSTSSQGTAEIRTQESATDAALVPAPMSTPGRLRSFSDSDVDCSPTKRLARLARSSNRSLRSLIVDPFPWNNAASYPWSNSIPLIDIRFPQAPSPRYTTPRSKLSHLQHSAISNSSQSSLGSLANTDETSMIHGTEDTSLVRPLAGPVVVLPTTTKRRTAKKTGLIGALSRKILGPVPTSADAPVPELKPSPQVKHVSAKSNRLSRVIRTTVVQSHDSKQNESGTWQTLVSSSVPLAGSALNVDDVHSFFSDDSSTAARYRIRQRDTTPRSIISTPKRTRPPAAHCPPVGSMRKRLTTRLRHKSQKGSDSAPVHLPEPNTSQSSRPSSEIVVTTPYTPRPVLIAPVVLMTPTEVRAKRLVDRFKILLHRSGELFRTMSGRKRHVKSGEDEGWSDKGESYADLAVGALTELGAPTVRDSSSRTISMLASPGS